MKKSNKRLCPSSSHNTFLKLLCRETSTSHPLSQTYYNTEQFRGMRIHAGGDTHDPQTSSLKLSFLQGRSKIIEIIASKELVFALTQTGVCAVFNKRDFQRQYFLNITPDEVIRSLFYNKRNDSIITVSVYREDNFSTLKIRTIPLLHIIKNGNIRGFNIFEEESLRWPGFIEFDDVNSKILTFSANNKTYKIWDLTDYHFLFKIQNPTISEVKISPGILLLIHNRKPGHLPLHILNIENGFPVSTPCHFLHRNKNISFVELFNEKLLIKQEGENMQIRDIYTGTIKEVDKNEFRTPSSFIFLFEKQLFLTFRYNLVQVWNFNGELVTKFEDHTLFNSDSNNNNIHISSNQDYIISYCQSKEFLHGSNFFIYFHISGTINISNILTGKCIAKITPRHLDPIYSRALEEITAIYYDDNQNELFYGNRSGQVYQWY